LRNLTSKSDAIHTDIQVYGPKAVCTYIWTLYVMEMGFHPMP